MSRELNRDDAPVGSAARAATMAADALDHDSTSTYALTPTVTDTHGGSATTTVRVTVTDVPPAAEFGAASYE